ncbi:MAG: hypothetical protein AAF098_15085 [Pseudomonadota bacterium]
MSKKESNPPPPASGRQPPPPAPPSKRQPLAKTLIDSLGLDGKRCSRLKLDFEAGAVPLVEATMVQSIHDDEGKFLEFARELERYRLIDADEYDRLTSQNQPKTKPTEADDHIPQTT